MKCNFLNCIAAILFTVILISCKSTIEYDAKKAAELTCKSQQAAIKLVSGDLATVMAQNEVLIKEATKMKNDLEKKYTTKAERQKFLDAFLKEMENCK
ncbi:hypothetical protein BH11BAC3_BH11BAC3_05060 [soil metagenome]